MIFLLVAIYCTPLMQMHFPANANTVCKETRCPQDVTLGSDKVNELSLKLGKSFDNLFLASPQEDEGVTQKAWGRHKCQGKIGLSCQHP